MKPRPPASNRHRGAVAVETGIVLPVFLIILLGIFEYSRFVMMRNLVDNAAHEGARTAVVHTYDYTTTQVRNVVINRLAGQDGQLSGLTVDVFKVDPTTGANLDDWTNARFGDWIMVRVRGTYRPAVTNLLRMSSSWTVTGQSMMRCEAN